MRLALAVAAGAAFAVAPASSAEAVDAGRPPVALTVSPARVALIAPASRTLEVRNVGGERVVVDVARGSDRGTAARDWLRVRPARLMLRSGAKGVLTVRARVRRGARPGDHQLRVFLVARPVERTRVAVRIRLGVGVRVRMPGRIVRHLDLRGLRVRKRGRARVLLVSLANGGNVTEQLQPVLSVSLIRRGRVVGRLRAHGPRELLPGARAVVRLPYEGRVRGLVTAVVHVPSVARLRPLERRYRIRL